MIRKFVFLYMESIRFILKIKWVNFLKTFLFLGAKHRTELHEALTNIYPILKSYKKIWTDSSIFTFEQSFIMKNIFMIENKLFIIFGEQKYKLNVFYKLQRKFEKNLELLYIKCFTDSRQLYKIWFTTKIIYK